MKINPKNIERAMRKMGIQPEEIPAEEVIIRTQKKEILITNPQVTKINMMGQDTFQVVGEISERSREFFSEEDVQTVMNQTQATEEEVKKTLEETSGDLAEAILKLKKGS